MSTTMNAMYRPTAALRVSAAGLRRIRGTESVQYRYYNDMGEHKGHCSWGIGILAHRGVCTKEEIGKQVSPAEVEAGFARQIAEAEDIVHCDIKVELTQEQFDGLTSFVFNTGRQGAHDTFAMINKGDFNGAGVNMQSVVRVLIKTRNGPKKVIAKGLVRRRAEESASFLSSTK